MPNHPSTINSNSAEQFGDAAVLETPKKNSVFELAFEYTAAIVLNGNGDQSQSFLDCSPSPIFSWDRRDIARLTLNGGHLDFQTHRGEERRGLEL